MDFYRSEYPDVTTSPSEHFLSVGWIEGRNPNPYFDTTSYLTSAPDVARSGINPYLHYLTIGRQEGRIVEPSASPSVRTTLLFGQPVTNWVDIIFDYVDVEYYRRVYGLDAEVNAIAHFAYRGWRIGASPNAATDMVALRSVQQEATRLFVNPLVAHLYQRRGPIPTIKPKVRILRGASAAASHDDNHESNLLEVISPYFDEPYYKARYPDIASSSADPLQHYAYTGWREGRDPCAWFCTEYYLSNNADVRDAGVNPFWHFLVAGRVEGRRPKRPRDLERSVVEEAWRQVLAVPQRQNVGKAEIVSAKTFWKQFAGGDGAGGPIVLSFSHDSYTENIGGTQIFIADEERQFTRSGVTYVHLAPSTPSTRFEQNQEWLILTIDGKRVGLVHCDVLATPPKWFRLQRTVAIATIHSMLGHSPEWITKIIQTWGAKKILIWGHDYSLTCTNYNLLRNNLEYCGLPPTESLMCRVCAFGAERKASFERVLAVLRELSPIIVAPSEAAALLLSKGLKDLESHPKVVPHWRLVKGRRRTPRKLNNPTKTGFVGYPVSNKGWLEFLELSADPEIRLGHSFFHFTADNRFTPDGVTPIATASSASDRLQTVRLLKEYEVDIVLVLSPWPETFSYVAHEAILSGAGILCFKNSGNVAALANQGFGRVCDSVEELKKVLLDPSLGDWLKALPQRRFLFRHEASAASASFLEASSTSLMVRG
ncbi:MAG: hypothetical protein KDK07_02375 [Bauldia sp.]|nr:hypothetical protein [Bauldia sp.]